MSTDRWFQPIPDEEYKRWQVQLLQFSSGEVSQHMRSCLPAPPENGFSTNLETVHFSCTARALNIYSAILLLLQHDFWEEATALSRSLYEMLLNLHEIHRNLSDPKDTEEQARKYVRFGALQRYLGARTDLVHGVHPDDDVTVDEGLVQPFDDQIEQQFAEFRAPKPKAPWHRTWKQDWCDKNIRELAEDSGDYRHAESYHAFFFRSSSLLHSTPYSVLSVGAAFPLLSEPDEAKRKEETTKDRQRGWLNAWFCATFYLIDIVEWTKDVLVGFNPHWLDAQRRAIDRIRTEYHPPFPSL